jgi:sodium/bile acid cotransporter 7
VLRRFFSHIDLMIRVLLVAILLATVFPAAGNGRDLATIASNVAIFVLFLLNGMRLPRHEVIRGIGNWRFLLVLAAWSFGAMALAGLGVARFGDNYIPPLIALGFLFLGALPSTVQAATAYSSIAGGNVALSVVAAALLNIAGVFVSAPLFSLIGGGEAGALGIDGLKRIAMILILPFFIGQLLQSRVESWIAERRQLVSWADRTAIGIAVYVAFSGAVEQGIWTRVAPEAWAVLLAGVAAMLVFAFGGAWLVSGALRLPREDRISFLFAGAHKSTAMGVPLAAVLFPSATAGMVLVPLLIYHLLQMVISAPVASRLARR